MPRNVKRNENEFPVQKELKKAVDDDDDDEWPRA